MTRIEDLHGQTVEVEQVDVIEDVDGIPSWIKVDRSMATVVIVPSLLAACRPEADSGTSDFRTSVPDDEEVEA